MLNVNLTEDLMKELRTLVYAIEEVHFGYLEGDIDVPTYLKARDRFLAETIDAIVDNINGVDEFDR